MGREKRLILKNYPNVISQYELMQKAKMIGEGFEQSSMLFKTLEVLKLDFELEEKEKSVESSIKKPPKIPTKKKSKKTSKKKGKTKAHSNSETQFEPKLILGEDEQEDSASESLVVPEEVPYAEEEIEARAIAETDTVTDTVLEASVEEDVGIESNFTAEDIDEISESVELSSDFTNSENTSENVEPIESESEKEQKNKDEKKEIRLSDLLAVNKKTKNFIFSDDIYHEMNIEDFLAFIDEIASTDYVPVFWFFEHDLLILDSKKENSVLARHLIKFMAEDEDNNYTHLVQGDKPKGRKLVDFCSENHITCVTGKYDDILECRLHSAKVHIPKFFKERFPNPLKGDKTIGFDSSAAYMKENAINELLSDAKTVILSSIQVTELINPNIYLLKVCAYYGQIRGAKRISSNPPDKDIVQFYKTNPVDVVYTFDSGFRMYAKFANVPCQLIKKFVQFTPSDISKKINSIFSKDFNEENLEDSDRIVFDTLVDTFDGKMRFYPQNEDFDGIITVFRNGHKLRPRVHYFDLINADFIIIRKNKKALVAEITNAKNCVGKIRFFGEEAELPRKYPNFSKI